MYLYSTHENVLSPRSGLGTLKNRRLDNNPGIHSMEVVDKVTNFYLTITWICPGEKDVVIVRKPGEEKTKLQKQYLLTQLKEAHAVKHII